MDWRGSLITIVFCLLLPGYYAQEFYHFTSHPANVYIAGSELEVRMSCTAAPLSNRAWIYSWRLNNQYLSNQPIGNAIFIGYDTSVLTIRPRSSIHDITIFGNNNNFTCVATNNNGPITSNIARVLRIGKPYFQGNSLVNTAVTYVTGQQATITCKYTPFPEIPVTLLWYYTNNGLLLSTSSDGRISISMDGTVYFANLQFSDAAPYRCAVRPNEPRTTTNIIFYSGNTTLNITPRSCTSQLCDFGPEFSKTSLNARGRVGSSVTLECIARGRPTPSISWCIYNPNTQLCNNIQASAKYTFNQASNRLTINSLIPQDAGTYRCTARSTRGSKFANNNLQIDPQLTWITRFTSMSGSVEDTVTLPCVALGAPPLKYTWYKQAILLPMTNSRFSMATTNGNLTIRSLNNDTGVYQCKVEDRYGSIASGGYFEVKVFAARFTAQMPKQQIIQVGPSAQLICPIDGGPKPIIDYFFNGNRIDLLSNKYQGLRTGNLLIRNVVTSDGGNYTCRGRNRINPSNQYVTNWATVHVYAPTKILDGPTTRDFRIGSTVIIPCNVTADTRIVNAVSVAWQKDGQPLQGSKYVVRNSYPNYALTINNAQIPESGNYTCTMTAIIAQVPGQRIIDSKTGTINFNAIPAAPRLIYGRLINSSRVFLNWTFASGNENNSPLQKFVVQFKSNYIATVRSLLEISNINQRSVFIIPSPYMTYTFYIAAQNGVGLSQSSNQWEINNPHTSVPTDAPTNLYSVADLTDLTKLTVVWTPLTGEQANGPGLTYLLRYRISGTVNSYREIDVRASSYTITGLQARTRYDFNLRARNDIGRSTTFIDHIGCTCQEAPIGTPFNVTVLVTNTNVVINWLQIPLHLQRGTIKTNKVRIARATPYAPDTIAIAAGTSIIIYGLPINTNFTVEINGINSVGEGPYSIAKAFKTNSLDTAHAPSLANPISADITNVTIAFQWTISGQPFYYQPQYRLPNAVWQSGNNLTRQSTRVVFTKLSPNTAYQFRVNAIYFIGRNISSNILTVQTKSYTGQQVTPWYQQAWFIIVVVVAGLGLVIAIVVILCKGRRKAVPKDKQNPPIPPPPETNNEEYDTIKRPPLPHPQTETVHQGDDVLLDNDSIDSLEQYADLPGLSKFNEDGSFIGEYGDKDMDRYSQYNRDSVVEQAGSQYGTVRDDASYHTNHNTLDVNDNNTTFSTFV